MSLFLSHTTAHPFPLSSCKTLILYIYILHCLLYAPHHQYCNTTIIIITIRKATSGCQSGKPPWANWNWNERVSLLFLDSGASVQDRSPLGLDFYHQHYCYLYCPKSLDTYLPKLADTSWRRRRAARKGSRGWSRAAAASIISGIFVWNWQRQNLTLLDMPARLIIRLLFRYAFSIWLIQSFVLQTLRVDGLKKKLSKRSL